MGAAPLLVRVDTDPASDALPILPLEESSHPSFDLGITLGAAGRNAWLAIQGRDAATGVIAHHLHDTASTESLRVSCASIGRW